MTLSDYKSSSPFDSTEADISSHQLDDSLWDETNEENIDPDGTEMDRLIAGYISEIDAVEAKNNASTGKIDKSDDSGSESTLSAAHLLATCTTSMTPPWWPDLPLTITGETQQSLANLLTDLTRTYRDTKNYWNVRNDFVRTSLALNQLGLMAPAFRDQPRIPYIKKDRNPAHQQLLIDQIIIDCHWLHCREERINPRWPELRSMFAPGSVFDCQVVSNRIAERNWSSDFRTNELFLLPRRQQVQLVQLRTNEHKENHRRLMEGSMGFESSGTRIRERAKVVPVRAAINEWASRTHQIRGHEEAYEALWLATQLLGPDASNPQIAELAALQHGTAPLNPRTVAGKRKQLERVLTTAGTASGGSSVT